ncbi:hypothetical protein CASFOL_021072 [Castilleja foliolosa]|uniref:Phytocyanin domain-containing protein n=1 Tax=Castilleja foliolosa TaxID=1961234 RepID=A0ABD3CVI1_9LAMI
MAKYSSGLGVGLMMMVLAMICSRIAATTYTVGDSSGWAMGGDYSTWASDKTFVVGDTLVFNYAASGHTVDEVSQTDYKSCTTGNSLTTDSSGATSITLKAARPYYFICGVPGHCSGGMKIAVTATAAAASGGAGAPAVTGTTTSPASTTTTPAGATGVATPRSSTVNEPSSSAALSPAVAAFFAVLGHVVLKGLVF